MEWVNLITTVGFPIVACVAMAWYVKDSNEKHRNEIRQLNDHHREEMDRVTTALNNNTIAIQKLCDKLERD